MVQDGFQASMQEGHRSPPLTAQQMKALEWLTRGTAHPWIRRYGSSPTRGTLDALIRRGLAIRSSSDGELYRITTRGIALSPPSGTDRP